MKAVGRIHVTIVTDPKELERVQRTSRVIANPTRALVEHMQRELLTTLPKKGGRP